MKIPSPVIGRTQPVAGTQAYTQGASNPGGGLAAIAQGANQLGEQFTDLGKVMQGRDKQIANFNALTKYSDFQTQTAAGLEELKRNSDPTGQGFTKAADDYYTTQQKQFLATQVPADLQPEFQARTEEMKKSVLGNALDFQYKQGDAYFNQGVSDELNKAKSLVDQNPDSIDAARNHLNETIDSSGLPADQKAQLKRDSSIALESIHYKVAVRDHTASVESLGVGPITDGASGASAVIKSFEGFSPTPYWDTNAYRVGYGSDTITTADGKVEKVTPGMVVTKEDAQRDLNRRTNEFQNTVKGQVGADVFSALPANIQAGLTSVAYNYGSLPDSVVAAVKQGDTGGIANAVAGLDANKGRRQKEAGIIRGTQGIDADPQYANIPYEDKIALQKDAVSEGKAAATQQAAQIKASNDTANNALFLGLLDGTKGQVDIDNARKMGTLNQYEDVSKADSILKKRDEDQNLQSNGVAKLSTPGSVWDPTSEGDKKMLNAVVGKQGLQVISAGDDNAKSYIHDGVVPIVSQTGDIPTEVAGTLVGMLRGSNNQQASFALDSLSQLRDVNATAFNDRVPSEIAKQVDLWDARKDLDPQDVLLAKVRGGTDAQSRQATANLRKEGEDILSHTTNGIPDAKALLSGAVNSFGGFFSNPTTYTAPLAMQSFQKEFNTLFIDAYSQTGDKDSATKLATQALHRDWAVTEVGGSNLMKYPPEKVGYKPINGSYGWINDQIKQDLNTPQFTAPTDLSPQEQNLLEYSRNNMRKGTTMDNNGDTTSVYITGIEGPDGRQYNVPGYADGKLLSPQEMQANAEKTGWDKYPSYATEAEAEAAAQKVHKYVEQDNTKYLDTKNNPVSNFQLFSDEQTRQEAEKFKSDPSAAPPSYRVFTIDKNGVAGERRDANGLSIRLNFQPPADLLKKQADTYDYQAAIAKNSEIVHNHNVMQAHARANPGKVIVSPEDTKAAEDAQRNLDALRGKDPTFQSPNNPTSATDPAAGLGVTF